MNLRLKELRKAKGWTQADVASMLGLSSPHISEMENGKKNPSRRVLEQMAGLFGVPVADMYEPDTDGPTMHSLVEAAKGLSEENLQIVNNLIAALRRSQGGQ